MAEPTTVTTGLGYDVAVDDCGATGVAQLVKLAYSADGVATAVTADSTGLQTTLGTAIAGERNTDSATASYLSTADECYYTVVDTSTDSVTVNNAPSLLLGVFVNTVLSAHTVILKDNTTSVFTLPASLAAGTLLRLPATRFETSLIVDPDNSSTGNITVLWRPL